jgi:aryl-alcohol dehydrogenase-like predicted oxidoreductase
VENSPFSSQSDIDNWNTYVSIIVALRLIVREKRISCSIIGHAETRIYVATKCGRQINPHVDEGYTPKILRGYVEDSLRRLQMECLDLIQLHCPPTQVYYRPEIFEEFDKHIIHIL